MKKILFSIAGIVAVAALVVTSTGALFSDTETSTGNVFTAGAIDLKVDHTLATYNGEPCVENCVEIGQNMIANGGFETPDVPTGGWAIYPDASQTGWTVESGAGLEIQDHAAGNPHGGQQLGELDSNNSSVISQTLTTVAGAKYRFSFWYSPRPNRPAGDNTIGAVVQVVSNSSLLVNDTIGAGSAGGANTSWVKYTYNFVAVDTSTKIKFSDLGTNNSYGGYLDDISVFELNCTSQFDGSGSCTLWGEKDLGAGDYFWNFTDIKPGDSGTNVISLHPYNNDAYVCLYSTKLNDQDVTINEPESLVDPQNPTPGPGELAQYIKLFAWNDLNGNGVYEPGTEGSPLVPANTQIDTEMVQLALAGSQTSNVGVAWCMGTQSVDLGTGVISCNGAGNHNDAQTDSLTLDMVAYAVQQRNNPNFSCVEEFRQPK